LRGGSSAFGSGQPRLSHVPPATALAIFSSHFGAIKRHHRRFERPRYARWSFIVLA